MNNKSIEIIVDHDPSLNYETKKWPYLILPWMWILTGWVVIKKGIMAVFGKRLQINTFWVDGYGKFCREVKEGATSWRALDVVYNFEEKKRNGCGNRLDHFWINGILNAQAVRNRFKLVKRELIKAVNEIAKRENEVRLLSIASGSAQVVLETMKELRNQNYKIKAIFLDLDPTAIAYSRKMTRDYGFENQITFINESTTNFEKAIGDFSPNIIEMVGFLDYRPRDKAIKLVARIKQQLAPSGIFITANTCPNVEQFFMKWVVDWSMIYRKPKKLVEILTNGGFDCSNLRIICEPLKIHAVAVCKNN